MSRPRNQPPPATIQSPDNAAVTKPMVLTGLVRTSRGFAVATATLEPDGTVRSVRLGHSQAFKTFVAMEHQRELGRLANET